MASSSESSSKSLSTDQILLLMEVIKVSDIRLSAVEWDAISDKIGATNGRAAKERFRYLLVSLEKAKSDEAGPKTPSKAKSKAPRTPRSSTKASPRKRKTEDELDNEDGSPSKKQSKDNTTVSSRQKNQVDDSHSIGNKKNTISPSPKHNHDDAAENNYRGVNRFIPVNKSDIEGLDNGIGLEELDAMLEEV